MKKLKAIEEILCGVCDEETEYELLQERRDILNSMYLGKENKAKELFRIRFRPVLCECLSVWRDLGTRLQNSTWDLVSVVVTIKPGKENYGFSVYPRSIFQVTEEPECIESCIDQALWRICEYGASWFDIETLEDFVWIYEVLGKSWTIERKS